MSAAFNSVMHYANMYSLCLSCKVVMSKKYRCAGCDGAIHWRCSVGRTNFGEGALYWCRPCLDKQSSVAAGSDTARDAAVHLTATLLAADSGTNEDVAAQPTTTLVEQSGTAPDASVQPTTTLATNEAIIGLSVQEDDTSSENNSTNTDNTTTKASALPPLVPLTQCIECHLPMEPTYLCKGCLKAIHCFCAVNKDEELGHGAHYWCKAYTI
jgi:hypothetical protein